MYLQTCSPALFALPEKKAAKHVVPKMPLQFDPYSECSVRITTTALDSEPYHFIMFIALNYPWYAADCSDKKDENF